MSGDGDPNPGSKGHIEDTSNQGTDGETHPGADEPGHA
jgi:hypothetical protein